MKTSKMSVGFVMMVSGAAGAASGQVTVFSNNGGFGDMYTNASGSSQGQAVGSSDFFYNNTRNSGNVGINTMYARSGNGSAFLQTTLGPGGSSSKADIELLAGGTNLGGNFFAASSFGRLGDLTSLSYDWYRDSASSNSPAQMPALRILVDADGDLGTTGDRGGIVFEGAYNGSSSAMTDTWVSEDIFAYDGGTTANMWTYGAGMSFAELGYGVDLATWQAGAGTIDGDSAVLGFSMGVGSGWGPFVGAVDNLAVGFNGVETVYNFEVVPAPGAMALLGLGGLAASRRRRG